jgi:hypothetical protein
MKILPQLTFSLLFTVVLSCIALTGNAQTQPVPYALSGGSFTFNHWDSLADAGTYPANMIFQFVPSNRVAPFYNDSATDYSCRYNLSKRPRINGYMDKGIGIVTTSSSQYNDCSSGAADKKFMGSILLALNTNNRANIRVQWKSETLVPGDGNGTPATPRIWNLRLQYRLGSTGDFQDVPGPVEFIAGTTSGDSTTLGPVALPAECNNKPLVQLRWIYFESSSGSGGTRPRIRFDDLSVISDAWVGFEEPLGSSVQIVPNPASLQFSVSGSQLNWDRLRITDITGKTLQESINNEGPLSCNLLENGIYFVTLYKGKVQVSSTQKLIIQR